jgi:hypothetical protein
MRDKKVSNHILYFSKTKQKGVLYGKFAGISYVIRDRTKPYNVNKLILRHIQSYTYVIVGIEEYRESRALKTGTVHILIFNCSLDADIIEDTISRYKSVGVFTPYQEVY